MDAWWYNSSTSSWEQNTYVYNTENIPVEHTEFNGNEAGHTTYTSCEQKGRAVWYMLASLAGWETTTNFEDNLNSIPQQFRLEQNYPNPFNPITTISYTIAAPSKIVLELFDLQGRKIKTLEDTFKNAGSYNINLMATTFPVEFIYIASVQKILVQ